MLILSWNVYSPLPASLMLKSRIYALQDLLCCFYFILLSSPMCILPIPIVDYISIESCDNLKFDDLSFFSNMCKIIQRMLCRYLCWKETKQGGWLPLPAHPGPVCRSTRHAICVSRRLTVTLAPLTCQLHAPAWAAPSAGTCALSATPCA